MVDFVSFFLMVADQVLQVLTVSLLIEVLLPADDLWTFLNKELEKPF